jgi:hypothetical protein
MVNELLKLDSSVKILVVHEQFFKSKVMNKSTTKIQGTKRIILIAVMLLSIFSCEKNPEETPDRKNPPPATVDIPLKDAKITLPAGSNYDLTGHELMAYGAMIPVEKDGKTKAADIKGTVNVAYLFDQQDNPILAGFITDSTSTLSAESTAKVLLYYASGAAFMPDTVGITFIQRAHEIVGVGEWIGEFTEMWKSNPKILSTGSYNNALRAKVKDLFDEPEDNPYIPNARVAETNRLTDILVDNNDIRSGLQVAQGEIGKIIISNYYRRRAHAFFYKTKYKPTGVKNYTVIHNDIGGDIQADKDIAVGATAGATSVTGTVVKAVNGAGMKFAVEKTAPIDMALLENEDEAIYRVHIVGVGKSGSPKTKAEQLKKDRLIVETFALDFVLPIVGMGIGVLGDEQRGDFVDAVDYFLKYAPGAFEKLNEGDFKGAVADFLQTVQTERGNELLERLLTALYKHAAEKIKDDAGKEKFLARTKNVPVLKVFDGVMQGADLALIAGYIINSKQLESWEVTVRKSQVRLEPKESNAVPFSQIKLDAIAKDVEESQKKDLTYQWRTSGKYGYLIDTEGNRGAAFENALSQVSYNCNASTSDLGDENIEHVYVDVYLKGELLGSDSTQINVQKSGYVMRPGGITVTGKKGTNGTQAKLFLKPVNWNIIPEIAPNDRREYKIVWSTEGKHGGLVSPGGGEILSTVTTYDRHSMVYECTDDQTITGSEAITARIYSRDKSDPKASFLLFDEVRGSVAINNDPKKRIVHLPVQLMKGDAILWDVPARDTRGNTYYTHQCYQVLGAIFKQNPEDASYIITFYSAGGWGDTESGRWNAGDSINGFSHGDNYPAYDGSTYKVGTGLGGWSVGPYYPDQPTPSCNNTGTLSGEDTCVLIVTLK